MRHLKYFVPQLRLFTSIPSEQPNQKKKITTCIEKILLQQSFGGLHCAKLRSQCLQRSSCMKHKEQNFLQAHQVLTGLHITDSIFLTLNLQISVENCTCPNASAGTALSLQPTLSIRDTFGIGTICLS